MSQNDNIEWVKMPAPKDFIRDSDNNIIMDSDGNPQIEYYAKKKYEIAVTNKEKISLKSQIEDIILQSIQTILTSYSVSCVLGTHDFVLTKRLNEKYAEHYNAGKEWIGVFSWEAFFQHILYQILIRRKHSKDKTNTKEKDGYLTLLKQSRKMITDDPNVIWDEKREELLVKYFLEIENPKQNICALLFMHILVASDIFENYDHTYPDEEKCGYSPKKFIPNSSSNMMMKLLEDHDIQKAFNKSAIKKIYINSNIEYSLESEKIFFEEVITNTALFIVFIINETYDANFDYHFYREIFRILCNEVFFNKFDIYMGLHTDNFSEWSVNNHNYEVLFEFPYNNMSHVRLLHDFLVNEILMPYEVYELKRNQRKTRTQEVNPRKGSLKELYKFRYNIFDNDIEVKAKKEQTRIVKAYSKRIKTLGLRNEIFFENSKKFQQNSPENHYNLISIMNFYEFSLFAGDVFDYEVYKNSFEHLKSAICELQDSILSQQEFKDYCFVIQPEFYYLFMEQVIYTVFNMLKNIDYSSSKIYSLYWKSEERRYRLKKMGTDTIRSKIDSILAPREC